MRNLILTACVVVALAAATGVVLFAMLFVLVV